MLCNRRDKPWWFTVLFPISRRKYKLISKNEQRGCFICASIYCSCFVHRLIFIETGIMSDRQMEHQMLEHQGKRLGYSVSHGVGESPNSNNIWGNYVQLSNRTTLVSGLSELVLLMVIPGVLFTPHMTLMLVHSKVLFVQEATPMAHLQGECWAI